ncbi:unnamed protein product [Rotaria sp. Silwood2]|nr:unnamed protein product [Rotaria sp. Silwood2]CAF2612137.1 unnamed protein product [Rotaria sp. Silwood2]CAF3065863.1 unnamed protein product [Rotaria sp. Silwood2]CAF3865414.1 unnamed protein product [Rotaria sp. Silwood2]CAF4194819.1 unnamed protein product [Rotaria sp. Silwood2]
MNVCTPNISWHGCDPVYSCAINPIDSKRLATAGMRGSIYLWDIEWPSTQQPTILFISALSGAHLESVNCIRWNSKGTHLASGSDDGNIFIWTKAPTVTTTDSNVIVLSKINQPLTTSLSSSTTANNNENDNMLGWDKDVPESKERWLKSLPYKSHLEPVLDLAWSRDDQLLVSGSVDKKVIVWNVAKREKISIVDDPKGFVQGVAIHPWRKYIAAMSTDRSLRIYSMKAETGSISRCVYNIRKIKPANIKQENGALMFIDETSLTFFRRCAYLPDGSQLIVSAGCLDKAFLNAYNNEENIEEKDEINNQQNDFDDPDIQIIQDNGVNEEKLASTSLPAKLIDVNCAYVFATSGPKFDRPLSIIPIINDQEVIAISVCPSLFPSTSSVAPYRMLFALITKTSLFFYDQLSLEPFAYARRIHLLSLTDGCWSHDGRLFIASSEDGYLTFVTFTEQCLGGTCLPDSDKILDDMMNNALTPTTTNVTTTATTTVTPSSSSSSLVVATIQQKKK